MWFLHRQRNKSGDEAKEALEEAEKKLDEVKSRGEEVTNISASLKRIRERNHFSETLEELILQTRHRGSSR